MKKNILFTTIVTVCIGYIGFCLFMYQQQYTLLYQPKLEKMTRLEALAEAAYIIPVATSDNIILEGWYFPPRVEDKKTIVFFHGNEWNIGESFANARYLLVSGYGLLMVEYRGYSGHSGKVNEQGLYKDGHAFINWLHTERGVSYQDMIFYGESLGSAVAVKMATEYNPHAVVLFSAFSSMLDIASQRYPYLPVSLLLKDTYFSDRIIKDISAPVLFLHGKKDELVNFENGQKLYDLAIDPKQIAVFEEGNHVNLYDLGARDSVINFLNDFEKQ